MKAFVLGAGLGTRLKCLTEFLPKPLLPLYHRPAVSYIFDHLIAVGVQEFIVNTHHCAEAYHKYFPGSSYRDRRIHFRHEPELLETGGGIANVADLIGEEAFIVYNGDILTDLPLKPALEAHEASGNLATLVLRSTGPARQIAWDPATGNISDIRNLLGTNLPCSCQFTGIYLLNPEFFQRLSPGKKQSVIPAFLEMLKKGEPLGGIVLDEGCWFDIGIREAYLKAHSAIGFLQFPLYRKQGERSWEWKIEIHPSADIHPTAKICPLSWVGENAVIGANSTITNSIIWQEGKVAEGASLENCIVRTGMEASGSPVNQDI